MGFRRRYYAVARGRRPGIYTNADLALEQTLGFSGFRLKRFPTLAQAEAFMLNEGAELQDDWTSFFEPGIFFDGGHQRVVLAGHCEADGRPDATAAYALVWPEHGHPDTSRALPAPLQQPAPLYCAEFAGVLDAMLTARGAGSLEIVARNPQMIEQLTLHMRKWRSNGWITCRGYPLMYRALLIRINAAMRTLHVRFALISGDPEKASIYTTAYNLAKQAVRS